MRSLLQKSLSPNGVSLSLAHKGRMPFGATIYRLLYPLLHLRFCPYAIRVGIMPFGATIYRLLSSLLFLLFFP